MSIIKKISYGEACGFLLPRHYSGRKPVISQAFGWYFDNKLKAVCTFGKPASPSLCRGIMNNEYSANVYELNRLCRVDNLDKQLSEFVAGCLKQVSKNNWIIVSYADTAMHHAGYIYQACNFLYTGATKARTDKYTQGNKHSRHYNNQQQNGLRKLRSAKHRYVYFATNVRKLKKEWMTKLAYATKSYPKTPNNIYELGNYLQPTIMQT